MSRKSSFLLLFFSIGAIVVAQWSSYLPSAEPGQHKAAQIAAPDKPTQAKFEFQVLESVDAKYLGDTPSHHGRSGLKGRTPNLALHDGVYRGKFKVGHVTSVLWDKARESLDVEFNPEPFERISVGDVVWVVLDGTDPSKDSE